MKYYIIAGEASGDLHGSNLMKALFQEDPEADFRFWGGDLMKAVGGSLVKHYRELAFMGFIEVVLNLQTIFNNIKLCKQDITDFKPDVIIFIDYPGFNLRIAKWAKALGYKTYYYISPKIWAWKENRIVAIKRDIDKMFVILPFEKDFYEKKHNYPVSFVGHPLIDAINNQKLLPGEDFRKLNYLDNKPIIAILPGSRKQEISKMLRLMLSVINKFPDYQFVIAGAPGQEYSFYKQFIVQGNVGFVSNQTYDLLNNAEAAVVASGTATLETALFKVPQVVCYKANWISYQIAIRVVDLKYISLVNLIMDKEVVTELLQQRFTAAEIRAELTRILEPSHRNVQLEHYAILIEKLGAEGASHNTARLISNTIP